jgi:hypothetical protein
MLATTFTVNTAVDELDFSTTDGDISIRDAIAAAVSGDTIDFDASTMNGATITLDAVKGQVLIDGESLTIDARMLPNGITIDANDPTPGHTGQGIRVFNITDPTGGANLPVTLIGLTLTGGDVGGQGGAIRSEARLVLLDCTIVENEADFGGAIYIQVPGGATSREVLRIEDSVIHDNHASNGFGGAGVVIISGGPEAPTSDTAVITGTIISDNKALTSGNGGGLYVELHGATLTISESTLLLNEAINGNGAGIFARLNDGATLRVVGSEIDENIASLGAGSYVELNDESTLRVETTTFYDNRATGHGGGIHATVSESTLEVIGSEFRQNNSGNDGGGIFAHSLNAFNASTVTIDQSHFEANTGNHGGGLYVGASSASVGIDESSFVDNDAGVLGGGIYAFLNDDATVEIVKSSISRNEAITGGGGVHGQINSDADATLEIRESQITGNIAEDGGGVRVDMPGFDHDEASGAVFMMERSVVEGNRATNRGGGILTAIGSGGQATIKDSVITGNDAGIALIGGAGDIRNAGGGMYAFLWAGLATPMLTIAGSEFSNNKAGQHGGGLALCTKRELTSTAFAHLSVYNTTFSGNQALYATQYDGPSKGGGVYLAIYRAGLQRLDARFHNVTITNNVADQGAGVWTYNPDPSSTSRNDVRLTNSIISGNKKHNGLDSNLYGSFNIPATVVNIIGSGNTTWTDNGQVQQLSTNNIFTDDPKLAPLAHNGGPTRTHALKPGSPAIDVGSNLAAVIPFTSMPLETDQRGAGFPRRFDVVGVAPDGGEPVVDIGAYEVDCIIVSTTADEFDTNYTYGDLSLREAVNLANLAGVPRKICLPAAQAVYQLTLVAGDLDITGNVTIIGDGPGLSVINGSSSPAGRILDVAASAVLIISRLTLEFGHGTSNSDQRDGGAIRVQDGGQLHMDNSAIVGSETGGWGVGGAIYFDSTASGSIESSVITVNYGEQRTGGLYLEDAGPGGGTVTIKSTIIANNSDDEGMGYHDIYVGANRTLDSLGNNRFTSAMQGPGFQLELTDYVGAVDYVVTSVADTYDGSASPLNMSLRDAIHQANITPNKQVIWLPAWEFRLTLGGTDAGGPPNVAIGDLDVTDTLDILGMDLASTKVDASGIPEAAFEQIGALMLTLEKVTVIN